MHPRFDLVLAGNRDERHERPAASLDWWSDAPEVLAGRDLEAGGTWLGVQRSGRVATVTNFREQQSRMPGAASRGALVVDFLRGNDSPEQFFARLERRAQDYAGFNLLLADDHELWYGSNRTARFARRLEPGIHGLSNEQLDTPWPKLVRSRDRLTDWIDHGSRDPEPLFALLADRECLPWGPAEPTEELARAASAPFIVNDWYGTRASTVVTREPGRLWLGERTFIAGGKSSGDSGLAFAPVAMEPAATAQL